MLKITGGNTLFLEFSKFASGLDSLKISDNNFADATAANRLNNIANGTDDTADPTERAKILGNEGKKAVDALVYLEKNFPKPAEGDSTKLRNFGSLNQTTLDTLYEYKTATGGSNNHAVYTVLKTAIDD